MSLIIRNWNSFVPNEIRRASNLTIRPIDGSTNIELLFNMHDGHYKNSIVLDTYQHMVEELIPEYCTFVIRDLLHAIVTRHYHGIKKVAPEPTVDEQIKELCSKSTTSIEFCLFKLQEELGEVAKAYNQPKRCDEPLENELVDLILVAKDALHKVQRIKQLSDKDIDGVFKLKMDKWKKNAGIA